MLFISQSYLHFTMFSGSFFVQLKPLPHIAVWSWFSFYPMTSQQISFDFLGGFNPVEV